MAEEKKPTATRKPRAKKVEAPVVEAAPAVETPVEAAPATEAPAEEKAEQYGKENIVYGRKEIRQR